MADQGKPESKILWKWDIIWITLQVMFFLNTIY